MSLTKSISGIRGTIGGGMADNLNPIDIVKYAAAFVVLVKEDFKDKKISVVIGRDGRLSGPMISHLLAGALISLGVDVLDIGLAATPTVQMAVIETGARAGIIISGSHNPMNWNA
jgi:phosphomannomutase